MSKLCKIFLIVSLFSCSKGEKNTASSSADIESRTVQPNISAPESEASTNDLSWQDKSISGKIILGKPLLETHLAEDSYGSTLSYSVDAENSDCDELTANPALSYNSSSGVLSATFLVSPVTSCKIAFKASSGAEEIKKTIVYQIESQQLLASITSISLTNPSRSPSFEDLPTFEISPLSSTNKVSLYSDDSCSQLVESKTVDVSPFSFTLTKALLDGSHNLYAMTTSDSNSSLCSSATVSYEVDSQIPRPATNLNFPALTRNPSSSALLSWTPSPTDGAVYKVSLGTSKGAGDIVSEEDAASLSSYTVNSLSLSDCVPVYPTVHTYSQSGKKSEDTEASNYFYLDDTPPSNPSSLSLSGYYVSGTSPSLAWAAASDNCSSTPSYKISLGTGSGDDSLAAWTDVSQINHAFSGLSLSVGDTVFMSVKSVDDVGLESGVEAIPFVVGAAPDKPVLGTDSISSNQFRLAWAHPNDNGRPISDYVAEYKELGAASWVVFNDGISSDNVLTITGLSASTNYEVRLYAENGEQSPYSDVLSVTTQIDDPFFDGTAYRVMNVGGALSSRMVALENSTTVTLADGVSTLSLNRGETHSFSSVQGDIISSDKPVYIAGRLEGSNTDLKEANVVWSSPSWAGREFVFNVNRYGPHTLTAYMFEAGNMQISEGTNTPTSHSFNAGEFKTISLNNDSNYFISSDSSALFYIYSIGSSADYFADPKPLLPSSNDLIGFASTSAEITVDADNTTINWYISDATSSSASVSMSSPLSQAGKGSSGYDRYKGYATRYISVGGKMSINSVADGDGNCSSVFLPVAMMKKRYAINADSHWVAFASLSAANITITEADGSTSSMTLTKSGNDEKTPYYGRLSSQTEGAVYTSDSRFAAWYEPGTDNDAATDDETILFGFD